MNAKALVCLTAVFCLTAIPAGAFYSDEYFTISYIEEVADDNGKIVFAGEALNISEVQAVNPIQVLITLKRQGLVLAVISARPVYDPAIQPGQTFPFTVESDFEQGQYDDFSIRVTGYVGPTNPNVESLAGAMTLVEESLNLTTFDADSTTVVLGELYNGTNGILTNISLEFRLFKDEDCLVGIAIPSSTINEVGSLTYQDVAPGSTIGFIAYSAAHLSKVERWEYSLSYELVRLAPVSQEEPTAQAQSMTAITGATWGKIKAMGRR